MSTPPQPPGARSSGPLSDDRTRDIRRPSLPDRPPAAVRPKWEPHVRPGPEPAPAAAQPDAAAPVTETVRLEQRSPEAPSPQPDTLAGQPTDKLSSHFRVQEQTLAFGAPADGRPGPGASGSPSPDFAAPAPSAGRAAPVPSHPTPGAGAPSYGSPAYQAGAAPGRGRRWPWVVLILLPILVIAVSGVLLFLLFAGA